MRIMLIMALLAVPKAADVGGSGCQTSQGTCCCRMTNGLPCCGQSANCGQGAISGCPCGSGQGNG